MTRYTVAWKTIEVTEAIWANECPFGRRVQ